MSYGHWMCKIYHITTRCPPKTVRKKQHPGRICIMGLQDFWCIPACCFHRMFWHHPSVQIEISKRKKKHNDCLSEENQDLRAKRTRQNITTSHLKRCAIVWKCVFVVPPCVRIEVFSICSLTLATSQGDIRSQQICGRVQGLLLGLGFCTRTCEKQCNIFAGEVLSLCRND